MKHYLSRKEMKRDEVREALGRGFDFLRDHERLLLSLVGGLVGVLLLAALVVFLLGRRQERAAEALTAALRIYDAKVDPLDAAPEDPENPRFATDEERLAKAKAAFEALDSRYGGTGAGKVAKVYLGEMAARQGDHETAAKLWREYLDGGPDSVLAASVELNLLELDRETGRLEEARSALASQLEPGADRTLPADVVLHELALTLERLGRESEAQETLQRLVDDHPRSPFAPEARRKLQERAG